MERYFFSINIESPVRELLHSRIGSWISKIPGAGVTAVRDWHLTLLYIGYLTPQEIATLASEIPKVHFPPSEAIQLEEFGGFPNLSVTNVLWLGVGKGLGLLNGLHVQLRKKLGDLGINYDKKPYVPHLTLAHLRDPMNFTKKIKEVSLPKLEFIPRKISLMRSRDGHPYDEVLSAPL